jgi:type IV pilus assembly protein PilN
MMKKINLLPLAERPSKWPVNRLFLLSGLFIVMLFSSICIYNVFTLWDMEKQLQNTRNQYELLQPAREAMLQATKKQELLSKKNNLLVTLTNERKSSYNTVVHLTALTSPQIWFTDIEKTDKDLIQAKGWAEEYLAITEFMQKLEQDQFFADPLLVKVENDATSKVIKFEITAKPKGI